MGRSQLIFIRGHLTRKAAGDILGDFGVRVAEMVQGWAETALRVRPVAAGTSERGIQRPARRDKLGRCDICVRWGAGFRRFPLERGSMSRNRRHAVSRADSAETGGQSGKQAFEFSRQETNVFLRNLPPCFAGSFLKEGLR